MVPPTFTCGVFSPRNAHKPDDAPPVGREFSVAVAEELKRAAKRSGGEETTFAERGHCTVQLVFLTNDVYATAALKTWKQQKQHSTQ